MTRSCAYDLYLRLLVLTLVASWVELQPVPKTPTPESRTSNSAGQLEWAITRDGRVAYDAGDCPCSTVLSVYGQALPDTIRLFEQILQPADLAVVVGAHNCTPYIISWARRPVLHITACVRCGL